MADSKCYWSREGAATSSEADLIKHTTLRAIDDAMPSEQERGHLGMSQIGKTDIRSLWLKYRWSLPDKPEPRIKRIFRVGHILEGEVVALLRNIPDVTVHETNPQTGAQFNFSFLGGHFSGSMDGCVVGIPEAPKTWHVLEVKTVSAKRFAILQKQGVQTWSPEYYAQLQCYMGASGMDRSLFVAYNKDNSDLHIERVKIEPMFFDAMIARAERIIADNEAIPASSYPKREWFEAKFMSEEAQGVYWGDTLPAPNCRNCRFAVARMDRNNGAWWCNMKQEDLSIGSQRIGCEVHNYIPALMPHSTLKDLGKITARYVTEDSTGFVNGYSAEPQAHVFSSRELFAISKAGLNKDTLTDSVVSEFRMMMGATVKSMEVVNA